MKEAANSSCLWCLPPSLLGTEIVHEDLKMGSDGESDQASGTSSDEVQSPVRVRMRNNPTRKISTEVRPLEVLVEGVAEVLVDRRSLLSLSFA